jgi:hypothetical protein
MLRNLCAVLFLVLAASPYTAPFQTCTEVPAPIVGAIDETDPGSLIAPLVTTPGHLTIVLPSTELVLLSHLVPVGFLTAPTSPTNHRRDSIPLTTLRV